MTKSAKVDDGRQRAEQKTTTGGKVDQESFNSIFMMADSGARDAAQIRQLAGMRALWPNRRLDHRDAHHGELPRRPETFSRYFISTHGARGGPGGHGAEDRELRVT